MADCTVTGQAVPGSTAAAAPPATGRVAPTVHSSACPPHVLEAIYGKVEDKKAALEHSLHRWWTEYADRKNDEEDEHVADSLLYDRNHLPRTAPAPDCVQRVMQQQREQQQRDRQQQKAQARAQ
ncbi:hypothetical protein D9Q98_001089 [Chlorella vulgaris]|uniref:Uncharacterized protein n=1 Tax=Chlorella vulgaris TaxID=3077 RepID=A0A9D4Z1T7_CHLVU|nr:hypothetical protein D9Q98_001089 [Chlorella vulgaris]